MTYEEKIKMYKVKKAFIDNLSKAFEAKPRASSVDSIEYEVYKKESTVNEGQTYFVEYLVVNFFGGAISVKTVNGNSCTANFRALGELIDGGYYDEVRGYETLDDNGFEKVNLDESKLDRLLKRPMTHIAHVKECFMYCEDEADVARLCKAIPSGFGTFCAIFNEEEETFLIINEYEENGDFLTEEVEYDYYTED